MQTEESDGQLMYHARVRSRLRCASSGIAYHGARGLKNDAAQRRGEKVGTSLRLMCNKICRCDAGWVASVIFSFAVLPDRDKFHFLRILERIQVLKTFGGNQRLSRLYLSRLCGKRQEIAADLKMTVIESGFSREILVLAPMFDRHFSCFSIEHISLCDGNVLGKVLAYLSSHAELGLLQKTARRLKSSTRRLFFLRYEPAGQVPKFLIAIGQGEMVGCGRISSARMLAKLLWFDHGFRGASRLAVTRGAPFTGYACVRGTDGLPRPSPPVDHVYLWRGKFPAAIAWLGQDKCVGVLVTVPTFAPLISWSCLLSWENRLLVPESSDR